MQNIKINKNIFGRITSAVMLLLLLSAVVVFFSSCLGTPANNHITNDSSVYTLSIPPVQDAVHYKVYFDNDPTPVIDGASTEVDITNYLTADGSYPVTYVAYDENGDVLFSTSYTYNYKAQSAADFMRWSYFMYGNNYTHYITSYNDLQMLVWHTLLYQQNNVRFYVDSSLSSLSYSKITDTVNNLIYNKDNSPVCYPEYDGLLYNVSVSFEGGNVARLTNFKYYLTQDHTVSTAAATANDLKKVAVPKNKVSLVQFRQNSFDPTKDTTFNVAYETTDKDTAVNGVYDRNFPIDDSGLQEVPVYNTEQLCMVVQYGAKPIFPVAGSVAETVYDNAREVLAQINSDNLSDYQKVLNIYRYLCENVTYDHVIFNYMDYISNYSVYSFGNLSAFYLEGIFYNMNSQVAVCDSIAKAFALMCNIEGIPASKINGVVGSGQNSGQHAWDKVKINGNWYVADCTWGMATYNDGGEDAYGYDILAEYLSHSYFLVAASGLHSRTVTYQVSTAATVDYNYYKYPTFDSNGAPAQFDDNGTHISLLISNATELKNVMQYFAAGVAGYNNGVEIKLTPSFFTSNYKNPGDAALNNAETNKLLTATGVAFSSYLPDFSADGYYIAITF